MNYDDLKKANPYTNVDYRKSGWQKFLTALGFRTNYDAYKESLALQAREYDAEVANKQYNEEYESPVAEAGRMRAAGLNPDLQGLGDVAGASAPDIGDENPPVAPESDEGQIMQFANTIMNVVTGAVGLASDFGSLKSLRLANDAKTIDNVSGLLGLAYDSVVDTAPVNPSNDPEMSAIETNNRSAWIRDVVSKKIPKRLRGSFNNAVSGFLTSLPASAESLKTRGQYVSDRRDYFEKTGSRYYDDSDEVMKIITEELVSLSDDAYYQSLKNSKREGEVTAEHLENSMDYETQINLKTAAGAENAQNDRSIQSQDMQKKLNDTMHRIITRLNGLAESDKRGHNIAEIALLMMSLMSMSQFNVSPTGASFGIKMGN